MPTTSSNRPQKLKNYMHVLLYTCFFLTVVACSPASREDGDGWKQFKKQYGKCYNNLEEEAYRKSVYLHNKILIKEQNERFSRGEQTFDLKINAFGDLSLEEFSAMIYGHSSPRVESSGIFSSYDPEEAANKTVDWRKEGAVTDVVNQGMCGSSWAYAATGSLEGQHFLKTGELVTLSVQNLLDCSKDFGNYGCSGGFMTSAFEYIKSNGGIDTEKSYPYEAKDGTCRFHPHKVGATVTGYVNITSGDEHDLKHACNKIGPISVAVDGTTTAFQFYHSGVLDDPTCSTNPNHGALVVGYGEEDGKAYWLVKNSFGKDWGDEGYILMSRNKDNQCGIATTASYPLV